jgi:hypothetical protein
VLSENKTKGEKKMAKSPLDLNGNGKMDMGDIVSFGTSLIFGIVGLWLGQYLGIVAAMDTMAAAYVVIFVGIGGIIGATVKGMMKKK